MTSESAVPRQEGFQYEFPVSTPPEIVVGMTGIGAAARLPTSRSQPFGWKKFGLVVSLAYAMIDPVGAKRGPPRKWFELLVNWTITVAVVVSPPVGGT